MSDETKTTSKPTAPEPTAFGIPFSQIPAAPWTLEALGHQCYLALAKFGAYGEAQNGVYPDLDPRQFAYGVAYKRIVPLLPMPYITNVSKRAQAIINVLEGKEDAAEYCSDEKAYEQIKLILADYEKLNGYLKNFFGDTKGTADNPTIPVPQPFKAKAR